MSRDSAEGFGTATPVVWRAAGYLGGTGHDRRRSSSGLSCPPCTLPGFGFGSGPGGNGPLQLTDPTLDLRRNLNQPEDRQVIEYQTDRSGRGLPAAGVTAPVQRDRLEQRARSG